MTPELTRRTMKTGTPESPHNIQKIQTNPKGNTVKKILALAATVAIIVGLSVASEAKAANPYIYGTQVGNTMVFNNTLDVPGDGYAVLYSKVNLTCTAPVGTEGFWTNDHSTYTRLLVRYGVRYVWVYRYVYDGENIGLVVPAHTKVTVTCV